MTTALLANIGPKGRIVIPQALRERHDWRDGTALLLVDDGDTVRLTSTESALAKFRASIAGTPSPVKQLLAERRQAAARGE